MSIYSIRRLRDGGGEGCAVIACRIGQDKGHRNRGTRRDIRMAFRHGGVVE